jgi:hypothetical protein
MWNHLLSILLYGCNRGLGAGSNGDYGFSILTARGFDRASAGDVLVAGGVLSPAVPSVCAGLSAGPALRPDLTTRFGAAPMPIGLLDKGFMVLRFEIFSETPEQRAQHQTVRRVAAEGEELGMSGVAHRSVSDR